MVSITLLLLYSSGLTIVVWLIGKLVNGNKIQIRENKQKENYHIKASYNLVLCQQKFEIKFIILNEGIDDATKINWKVEIPFVNIFIKIIITNVCI